MVRDIIRQRVSKIGSLQINDKTDAELLNIVARQIKVKVKTGTGLRKVMETIRVLTILN